LTCVAEPGADPGMPKRRFYGPLSAAGAHFRHDVPWFPAGGAPGITIAIPGPAYAFVRLRDRSVEGRAGFEPASNGFTNRFLSHLDHVPVGDGWIEHPTTAV
jgi:hypothetical protein